MNDGRDAPAGRAWRRGFLRPGPRGPAIVVKFGGSLLSRSDWPDLLRSLVEECRGMPVAVVIGGGANVDSIRRIDAAAGLDTAVSHRLAIDAMGITARLVAASTGWPLAIEPPSADCPWVVDVPGWLDAGGRFARLPAGWHVTSDSIAAFFAAETGSDLLLAKSVPPPAEPAVLAAIAAGWVDEWFETTAAGVRRIEWAAPVSPTTSRHRAGRRAPRAAASRRRGSRPTSRRPPRAG